eukprot:gene16874-23136_t
MRKSISSISGISNPFFVLFNPSNYLLKPNNISTKFYSVGKNEEYLTALKVMSDKTLEPAQEVTSTTKLQMYALFKQSENGPASKSNTSRPGIFDPVGRAKYDAWLSLGNIPKEEAEKRYVSVVKEVFGGALPILSNDNSKSDNVSNATYRSPSAVPNLSIEDIVFPKSDGSNKLKKFSPDFKFIKFENAKSDDSNKRGIISLKLNRPNKGNSFNMQLWNEFKAAFEYIEHTDARVVILSSTSKNFSTGMDLSVFADLQKVVGQENCEGRRREGLIKFIHYLQTAISGPEQCSVPVIAAISGHCIGGAMDLITACDLRYCTKDASFCVKETDLAIVADIGTLQRLPRLVGDQMSRELTYTSRIFNGIEAEKMGLVLKCFENESELMAHVEQVAQQIANKSPLTIRGVKKTILYSRDHTTQDSLQQVQLWNAAHLYSDDLIEATRAMLDKNTSPNFKKY